MICWDEVRWVKKFISLSEDDKLNILQRYPYYTKKLLSIYAKQYDLTYLAIRNIINPPYIMEIINSLEEDINYSLFSDQYDEYCNDLENERIEKLIEKLKFDKNDMECEDRKLISIHKVSITKKEIQWIIDNCDNLIQQKIILGYLYIKKYFNCKKWIYRQCDIDIKRLTNMNPNNYVYLNEYKKICSVNDYFEKERNIPIKELMYEYDKYYVKDRWRSIKKYVCLNIPELFDDDEIAFKCTPKQLPSIIDKYLQTDSVCIRCNNLFKKNSNRQKVCSNCKREADNEKVKLRMQKYRN